jgi:hypothetical protein
VEEKDNLPKDFALLQNYPNPFNPSTVIRFDLPKESKVTLKVYNALGQVVNTLVDGELLAAGRYEKQFNAMNLPSGVYFYRIETPGYTSTKKMILMK